MFGYWPAGRGRPKCPAPVHSGVGPGFLTGCGRRQMHRSPLPGRGQLAPSAVSVVLPGQAPTTPSTVRVRRGSEKCIAVRAGTPARHANWSDEATHLRRGGSRWGVSLVIGRVQGIEIQVHPTLPADGTWVVLERGDFGGDGAAGVAFRLLLMFFLFIFVLLHGWAIATSRFATASACATSPSCRLAAWRGSSTCRWSRCARSASPSPPRRIQPCLALLFAPPVALIASATGVTHLLDPPSSPPTSPHPASSSIPSLRT